MRRPSFRSRLVTAFATPLVSAAALCLLAVFPAAAQTPPSPTAPPPASPVTPPASAPATPPATPSAASKTGPPRLPPFAGTVVSFDRRGERVVACVDRSTVPMRPGAGAPQPPAGVKLPPAYRIWLIEREVMQELLTTGGLCHPVWSPDGKTFLAAGARGLFTFTQPQYEARVLTALLSPPQNAVTTVTSPAKTAPANGEKGSKPEGAPVTPPPGAPTSPPPGAATVKTTDGAPIPFSQTSWSPGGGRIAFLLTAADGSTKVRVVDTKDGKDVFTKDQAAKLVQWGPDDRTLVIDGARVTIP